MDFKEVVEKCKDDQHCYHRDGILLMSMPAQYRMHCCECGHMKYERVQGAQRPPDWGQHGRFYREGYQ
jgi:hypothetical protein